jgi:hypothetical protein
MLNFNQMDLPCTIFATFVIFDNFHNEKIGKGEEINTQIIFIKRRNNLMVS